MNRPGKGLQAAAGHVRDLYRLARFDVFNPHSYSKFRTLRSVQQRTGATQLIETGTYLGVTTRRCAPHFAKVFTIELDHELATQAREQLRPLANVTLIEGDADREMRTLFEDAAVRDVLVFLDGHYSGAGTAVGDAPEPAVDVLEFLAQHESRLRAVVVDDFREFGTAPGWPKKWQLVRAAEELFVPKGFRLTIQLDQLLLERVRA